MPFLLIDKPAGLTSHDVVNRLRRITGERTIGHAGTLDPFATGLLIIGIQREATKHLDQFLKLNKEYRAEIRLGETTETLDPEGQVTIDPALKCTPRTLTPEELARGLSKLTGPLLQLPPMYSAIKQQGKKLYELARAGQTVHRDPRPITIYSFSILTSPESYSLPATVATHIACSSGTYVRALARDLGEHLGTCGYLTALRRTKIGDFSVENACKLADLTPETWQKYAHDVHLR